MTDDAKALTKHIAVSALVVLLARLVFIRALVRWVVLGLVTWWIGKVISK